MPATRTVTQTDLHRDSRREMKICGAIAASRRTIRLCTLATVTTRLPAPVAGQRLLTARAQNSPAHQLTPLILSLARASRYLTSRRWWPQVLAAHCFPARLRTAGRAVVGVSTLEAKTTRRLTRIVALTLRVVHHHRDSLQTNTAVRHLASISQDLMRHPGLRGHRDSRGRRDLMGRRDLTGHQGLMGQHDSMLPGLVTVKISTLLAQPDNHSVGRMIPTDSINPSSNPVRGALMHRLKVTLVHSVALRQI